MRLDDAMRVLVCDTCGAVIPRGVPHRVGHTTPDALADAEPAAPVTATTTAEGRVRFEICEAGAAALGLALLPDEAIDALH